MGAEDQHRHYDDPPRGEVSGEPLMLKNSPNDTLVTMALVHSSFIKVEASVLNKYIND